MKAVLQLKASPSLQSLNNNVYTVEALKFQWDSKCISNTVSLIPSITPIPPIIQVLPLQIQKSSSDLTQITLIQVMMEVAN